MTQKRRDKHSTEYGLWTREQPELDSKYGFVATNIDWLWRNYKTGLWMLKEEKRYSYLPKLYQYQCYSLIDECAIIDPNYRGLHTIVFENTSPEDGRICLDGREISNKDLVEFLSFKKELSWYTSSVPARLFGRKVNWNSPGEAWLAGEKGLPPPALARHRRVMIAAERMAIDRMVPEPLRLIYVGLLQTIELAIDKFGLEEWRV